MAIGTGLGSLHALASHRASDARDRDRHRDRLTDQDGSPTIFYNLILEVTDHHFWCILLVTQTNTGKCGWGLHKGVNVGRRDDWGPSWRLASTRSMTRYATSIYIVAVPVRKTGKAVLIFYWYFSYFIRNFKWSGFDFWGKECSNTAKTKQFLVISLCSLHWQLNRNSYIVRKHNDL